MNYQKYELLIYLKIEVLNISIKITLKKRINDSEFNLKTLYFNSLIKIVINRRYHLNDSFEEILNLVDIWINERSGWVINKIEELYINVANYEPLLGVFNSMKG